MSLRFKDWPLRAKLAALLVAASLVPLAFQTFVDLRQTQARLLDGMKSLLEARGDRVVRELDSFHLAYQRSIDRLARFPDSASYCTGSEKTRAAKHDELAALLATYPASDPAIRSAALIDAAGRVVAASQPEMKGFDLGDRPAVRSALQGTATISDPYISPSATGAIPSIAYIVPIRDAGSRVVCLAALWVRASALWEKVKASNGLAGPGSYAVIFDRMGVRVAHTFDDSSVFRPAGKLDPQLVERLVAQRRFGTQTRALLEDVRPFPEQFQRALAAAPDGSVFRGFAPSSNAWTFGVGRRFETVPWTVFYMVPEATFAAEIARFTRERLAFGAAIIVAAILLGLTFATTILKPLRALRRASDALGTGDYAARVEDSRRDEFGALGAAFNTMAERVQAQAASLQQSRDELDKRVQERTAELEAEVRERRRVATVLRERDTALRRAHELAKLAHVVTGPDGSFESWSDTLPLLIRVPDAEMPRSTRAWLELLHPDDRALFRDTSIKAARTGQRSDVEYRLLRADGRMIYVRQVIEPIPDASGSRWFSTLQDITASKLTEDELRASEEHTRLIVETALDAMITMDSKGAISAWNPQAEATFGWKRAEVIGRPLEQTIIPPAMREAHRRGLARYLAGGAPVVLDRRLEMTALHRDGREFPVELAITPIRTADTVTFSAFVRDITERKRAQEALRESQRHYQTLAESLPQLVWTSKPDGGFDYLSRQWIEYTGRPEEEQLGHGWAEQAHPDDREAAVATWAEATVRGDHFDAEFRIRRADGVYRWFKTRAVPLRDVGGRITKWFGSSTDFDDYKQADQRLKTQLERLSLLDRITRAIGERQDLRSVFQVAIRSLEQELPVDFGCVCLYDAAAHTLTVTSVGARSEPLALELAMTAQARVEIDENGLSRCVRGHLVHEPDIAAVEFPFPQRLARGGLGAMVAAPLESESQVFGAMIVARRAAHSFSSADCEFIRQLSAHVALAARQAQLHGELQQAYDDLRLSQQAVMQQERLRALGQMASGIAHDINNAISPVALYTESLLEREAGLSERGREQLSTIARAIDDVAATVSRMREFYRPREPQLALARVQLNRMVPQVIELTRVRWSDMSLQRGAVIKLQADLAPDLPDIMGLESEVREALTNLILNAVDAMPDGGMLTLRTFAGTGGTPARKTATVEVSDTGNGMDEETRRRCLEPFYTTKGERGTGLGLAMVYGVTQRHGADIEIDSALGHGTTVRLRFPAAAAQAAAGAADAAAAGPIARQRILVVDDDPLMLKSLREALELDGHFVAAANGGQAGIDAFRDAGARGETFDVVISDLGMPYVDGRKVASAIKGIAATTPVILLTGWGQRLVADGELPIDVDLVLSKPPKMREVRAALARFGNGGPEGAARKDRA